MHIDNRSTRPFEFVEGTCSDDTETQSLLREPVESESPPTKNVPLGWKTILVICVFVLGCMIGLGLGHNPSPPSTTAQPVKTVTVKVTVTRTVVAETVTLPDVCAQAVRLVREMRDEFSQLSNIGNEQADILSAMMVAILTKDTAGMQAAGTKQKALDNSQSENNRKLRDDYVHLGELLDQCTAALG